MSHAVETEKPNVSSSAALWAVLIFVGLIIAAINFVQSESQGEGHEGHGTATEQHDGAAAHEGHEAAQPQGEGHTEAAAGHDTAAHGEEHEAQPAHEEAHH